MCLREEVCSVVKKFTGNVTRITKVKKKKLYQEKNFKSLHLDVVVSLPGEQSMQIDSIAPSSREAEAKPRQA